LTALVGRTEEIAEVRGLLGTTRLLTLIGPGGVGKTRLALAVAAAQPVEGDEGPAVYWVDLAPVEDNDLVAPAVADAIGAHERADGRALDAASHRVGDGAALIVVDNCEHVAAGAAEAAHVLLESCARLRLMTTSREPLGIAGEVVWPVPTLSVPDEDGPGAAQGADAVKLFVERARSALPSFRLDDKTSDAVLQICRYLDGLPLAIELAVANLRALPVEEIARHVGDVFSVLVGGPRTLPERQQTLRATLDWSHRLLAPEEQSMLRRLSVFAGSFGLMAASRVGAEGDLSKAVDLLRRLVDKSWVVATGRGGRAFYRLLATVRQYAAERLVEAGDQEQARRAHLSWYRSRAVEAEPRLEGATQQAELELLDGEINDVRAALQYARSQGEAGAVLEISSSLARFWYLHGHYGEGREWLDWGVVNGPEQPDPLRAKALRAGGHLAFLQCEYPAAFRPSRTALRLFSELGDAKGTAVTLQVMGSIAREQGRYQQAAAHHLASLGHFEACGDAWGVASAHGYLAFNAWLQGDFEQARAQCGPALSRFRALGDAEGTAWSLLSLGIAAAYEGREDEAERLLGESRLISDGMGFREGTAWSLEQQGRLAWRRGQAEARPLLWASARAHRDLGDQWRLSSVLDALAMTSVTAGAPAEGAELLGAADKIRQAIGAPVPPCEQPERDAAVEAAAAALGPEVFERAWQRGAGLPSDQLFSRPEPPVPPPAAPHSGRTAGAGPAAAPGPSLVVAALGASHVTVDGRVVKQTDWGYAKPRELFFLLCSTPSRTKEQLGDALWPELGGTQLRNALHSALKELRRALGGRGWALFAQGRYAINRGLPFHYDVADFEEALAAARRAPVGQALPHLLRALSVYKGDFLSDIGAGEWAQVRRRELRAAYETALGAAGAGLSAAGRYRQAVQVYERAIAHEPLNEGFHRELMTCLARLGQPARALAHFEQLSALLRREMDLGPAPETARLAGELRSSTGPR
jgi:predicted ATPase/DNA-binding SARP family transcriptional activator